MAVFTTKGEEVVLGRLLKDAGTELCLALDPELNELTDSAYSRVNLPSVMGAVSGGAATNNAAFDFNTGEEVALYWFVVDSDTGLPTVYGQLPTPQVGLFTFPVGAFRLQAVAG